MEVIHKKRKVKKIVNKESPKNRLKKVLNKAFGLDNIYHIVIMIFSAIFFGLLVGHFILT